MRSTRPHRALFLAATLAAALASAGCPELNRQPLKTPGLEFSEGEPAGDADVLDDEGEILVAQQGELPDRARRAR